MGFTTISNLIILLSRWQRIQTISKIRIRIFRIGCWHVMNNILAFGPYWRAERREPSGHNNITNDDTSFEVAENTDKQKWMWFRHTDRLYGMTALLFFVYYIYKPYKVIHRSTFHTRKYILDFPNRFNALLILHVNVLILFITLTDSSKCWISNNDLCIHIILIWFRPFWLCI